MNEEITPQMKAVAMASHFYPILKQIIHLATVAEEKLSVIPQYGEFVRESKLLCFHFADLCKAGDIDAMVARFQQTLLCAVAAQQSTTQSQVN
jgi:hypothetical protein